MKLPRDLSGQQLAKLLQLYGYTVERQTGSHMRLSSNARGDIHSITIPAHRTLTVGTLSSILSEVAAYRGVEKSTVIEDLFK